MNRAAADSRVTALAAGRIEEFAALYDRLGSSMLRAARTMLADAAEAEDAVQDVFVELVRRRERLTAVKDLEAYVFGILRHIAIRRLRRGSDERFHLRRRAASEVSRAEPGGDHDLDAALAELPPDQRMVIALKIESGLTFQRVAEVLRISPNTAASRYRYAMEKLRRAVK